MLGFHKYSGELSVVKLQLAALESLEGFPLKPSVVGSACADLIKANPNLGVTTRLANIMESEGTAILELPSEVMEAHLGKTVEIDGLAVVIGENLTLIPKSEEPIEEFADSE